MVKRLLLNARESGGFWLPGGIVVEDAGVDPVVSVGVVPGWGVERGVDEDVAVGVGVGVPGVGDGVGVIAVLVGGGGGVGDGGSVQVHVDALVQLLLLVSRLPGVTVNAGWSAGACDNDRDTWVDVLVPDPPFLPSL